MQYLTYTKKIVLGLAVGANVLGLAVLTTLHTVDTSRYSAAAVMSTLPLANPNCIITIDSPELDPAYIQSVITNRKFTPPNMPVTALDDLIIKIDSTKCLPDPKDTAYVAKLYSFTVSVVTTDANGREIVMASLPMMREDNTYGTVIGLGRDVFLWKINLATISGALSSQPFLETLIDSIAKKRPVKVKIKNNTTTTNLATFPEPEKAITMTNCYQAYGNGENKVIMMRALLANPYTIRPSQLLADITDIKNDFLTHSPLTQNIAKFSFYADLKQIDEGVELAQGISPSTSKKDILGKVLSNISRASSCGSEGTHVLRSTLPGQILIAGGGNFDGFTNGGGNIIIDTESGTSGLVLHEFGHSFGYLNDEYEHSVPAGVSIKKTNCSQNPSSDYKNGSQLYGATKLKGCTTPSLFRPSNNSLMNNPHGPEFNTVSCGYMLSRLKGGSPKSNFPACNIMTGIIHYP